MQTQLGESMPVTEHEQQAQYLCVMTTWQQACKNRNRLSTTAPTLLSRTTIMKIPTLTWSTSSKSQAAIFFNSDIFLQKRRMVSQPKVGTWQKLHNTIISSATESAMVNELSHRRSSSAKTVPLRLTIMRSKWMKIAFQTPSSNSCNKSTTSMRKKSKPV